MRWKLHVTGMQSKFWLKPEGKILLERPSRRWEDNIKIYLKETGCEGVD
jgi:hypothetical protein